MRPVKALTRVTKSSGAFANPTDALRAAKTSGAGALKAMTEFGVRRDVALAALSTTRHAARSLPLAFLRDNEFVRDALRANPLLLLEIPKLPSYLKPLLARKNLAEQAVLAQVDALTARLNNLSRPMLQKINPEAFDNVVTLEATLRALETKAQPAAQSSRGTHTR